MPHSPTVPTAVNSDAYYVYRILQGTLTMIRRVKTNYWIHKQITPNSNRLFLVSRLSLSKQKYNLLGGSNHTMLNAVRTHRMQECNSAGSCNN